MLGDPAATQFPEALGPPAKQSHNGDDCQEACRDSEPPRTRGMHVSVRMQSLSRTLSPEVTAAVRTLDPHSDLSAPLSHQIAEMRVFLWRHRPSSLCHTRLIAFIRRRAPAESRGMIENAFSRATISPNRPTVMSKFAKRLRLIS